MKIIFNYLCSTAVLPCLSFMSPSISTTFPFPSLAIFPVALTVPPVRLQETMVSDTRLGHTVVVT